MQRKSITDKITGVDKLFIVEEDLPNTVASPLPTTDTCHRMTGYYISHQRDFIKKKAKEYQVTESAVMRVAVEELIKSGKI